MRILLSNDDGVHAPGLLQMFKMLTRIGDVWVAAPLEEKSTTGHSLTIHKPLRVIKMANRIFGVSGSPADCINVGLREIMKSPPDLVVSGINRGANLAQDVYYSGTVSAAREATIRGYPSFAVSLVVDFNYPPKESRINYAAGAKIALEVIRKFKGLKVPEHTLINLNVPDLPYHRIKGVRTARQGFRHYSGNLLKRRDHRGKDYFWVGGRYTGFRKEPGTDCFEVDKGFATITPIKLDGTDAQYLRALDKRFGEAKKK